MKGANAIERKPTNAELEQATCNACKVSQPLNSFYLKGKRRDKTCKACRCAERRNRYIEGSQVQKALDPIVSNPQPCSAEVPTHQSSLLSREQIAEIVEAFLLLEYWQAELDAQGVVSNSKSNDAKPRG